MKRIGLRIPIHLWEKVKSIVEYKGCTINGFIIELLWNYVEDFKKNEKE